MVIDLGGVVAGINTDYLQHEFSDFFTDPIEYPVARGGIINTSQTSGLVSRVASSYNYRSPESSSYKSTSMARSDNGGGILFPMR